MNAVCCMDFTFHCEEEEKWTEIKEWLLKNCKKWSFQWEQGAQGSKHFQGRFSLKVKKRVNTVGAPFNWHLSITSKENSTNMFYVNKEDTRIAGPWGDDDEVIYIPRQIREIENLRTWQEQIRSQVGVWDKRSINVVYCVGGNIGKSTLLGYFRAFKLARVLPPVNDYKDLLRMVCDMPVSRCYCIDMPRALNKDRLYGFYSAIETIKDGYAYDDRYRFKEICFDCPNIWIFTNTLPDTTMLSNDRWKIWMVDDDEVLIPYDEEINMI